VEKGAIHLSLPQRHHQRAVVPEEPQLDRLNVRLTQVIGVEFLQHRPCGVEILQPVGAGTNGLPVELGVVQVGGRHAGEQMRRQDSDPGVCEERGVRLGQREHHMPAVRGAHLDAG